MKNLFASLTLAAFLGSLLICNQSALAQGTAFTYQGRLNTSGSPANGSFDFEFQLSTKSAPPFAPLGNTVTNIGVGVTNGLFTTTLDFGDLYAGEALWLSISVRSNGVESYTPMLPLQELTPAPYAIYAPNAGAAASANSVAGSNIVGTVPLGQLPPSVITNGQGSLNLSGNFSGDGAGLTNYSTNVALLGGGNTFTGNQIVNNGNVGIGTNNPTTPLYVQGIGNSSGSGIIVGLQTDGSYYSAGIYGETLVPGGNGVVGESDVPLPGVSTPASANYGVEGTTSSTNGTAVYGQATASSGVTVGVYGYANSPQGYAGYFQGNGYFSGTLGIGTTTPAATLEVNGNALIDGTLTAASFSGNGSGLTNLNAAQLTALPNLQQIAILKWGVSSADNTFSAGSGPYAMCFDGASIWVADEIGGVTKLDASTGATIGNFLVGAVPTGICFDGASIWVANFSGSNVMKLNASTGDPIGTYSVGTGPKGLCFDGASIWVANFGSNNVTKLNSSTGATIGTYSAGSNPNAICFDGASIWVANFGSNNVTKLNSSTGATIGTYNAGSGPYAICFDGASIWVANLTGANVTKLNASTGATMGTYGVGPYPEAICFDGASIWVANQGGNNVTKLNASTGATIGTYSVGSEPLAICFDGASIWVGNYQSNTVNKL